MSEPDMAILKHAVAMDAGSAHAHILLGNGYRALNRLERAIACFDAAIALQPGQADAHIGRSAVLLKQKRYRQSLAASLRATTLDPDSAQGWAGLGRVLGKLGQHKASANAYRKAIAIDPGLPFIKSRLLQHKLLACDWAGVDSLVADIQDDLDEGKPSARPFVWQAVATSPRGLQRCAEIYCGFPLRDPVASGKSRKAGARLRIGYISGEFRDHSISWLRAGLFEAHDKSRFEIIGFDNGWNDGGAVRRRIDSAMDRIVDIAGLSDAEAAAIIAGEEIDVLVDLNGFNGLNRLGVLALRPAPVQATLPGYPGTLGAAFIDYIVSDAMVLPPDHMPFYAEKAVHLPDCYQPNDRDKIISDRPFSRAEAGLPEEGFVFCCFNANYKILPPMFDAWMRVVQQVEGSVLWLLADNDEATANLRREAVARGIDPARLVFADRMPLAEHMARHACADLFLDTLPCNAHATASDALWAGLPLLTCIGETFSGRVAASLLKAVGLPEMIATTLADYEATAIRLATDPATLAQLKTKLANNRLTTPLFDTPRYTRHLEAAYVAMHERYRAGQCPVPLAIDAVQAE
jgi:predicted O-linked N-acetylglucosamine transferase (SPINDLY family)